MDKSNETEAPSLAGLEWLEDPRLGAVFDALEAADGVARIAGGAVRNGLFGLPVKDIDIATDLHPDEVCAALKAAGIKSVDTGIAHGTVTAIVHLQDSVGVYEVTTLRVDVETFGRHANVEFTSDWIQDASRRDFTINAIYANRDGSLFDPLGGIADIGERKVRFVGNAGERIEEDYLRVLRFFRIHAEYGEGPLDSEGLDACRTRVEGLRKLSAERIRQEMMKLLVARRAADVVQTMSDEGLLAEITATPPDIARFERLCVLEDEASHAPDALLRLAALLLTNSDDVAELRRAYVLTNAEKRRLHYLASERKVLSGQTAPREMRAMLYRDGQEAVCDALFYDLSAKAEGSVSGGLEMIRSWEAPEFPLAGRDALAAGVSGPDIGKLLRRVEEMWIASDFSLSEEDLQAALRDLAAPGT